MTIARRLSALAAVILAVWLLAPAPSGAQIPLPLPTSSPTSSPSPSPSPTTSESPEPEPDDDDGDDDDGGSGGKTSGGSTTDGKRERTSRPSLTREERAGIQDWLERDRTPARTTTRLLDLLARTTPNGKEPKGAALREGFGRFPVVGYVWYQDDYGAPRYSTHYSFHAGTDLFAIRGTPVIAVVDGEVWNVGSFSRGGNAVWLMGDDGVRYYYGHLQAYRKDLKIGTRLAAGELLGWVGDTGSAQGTYPHVHFEVNPGGLGTVNPKLVLDRWLGDAEAAAQLRVQEARRSLELLPMGAARWDSLFDLMGEASTPPASLWTAALDGSTTLSQLDLALAALLADHEWTAVSGAARTLAWDRLELLLPHADGH